MLVRADSLSKSMSHYLVQRIGETPNIHVEVNTEVVAVEGDERLRSVRVRRHDTGVTEDRNAAALFVFIGAEPHTEWLDGTICRDAKGFIPTGKRVAGWPLKREPYLLETNVPGVFAVGDVRDGAVRRVANSVGEGSIVLYFIHQYLANR
jgi:thioredoxin reductase (NADPH)